MVTAPSTGRVVAAAPVFDPVSFVPAAVVIDPSTLFAAMVAERRGIGKFSAYCFT
jgi:hypothetical protein